MEQQRTLYQNNSESASQPPPGMSARRRLWWLLGVIIVAVLVGGGAYLRWGRLAALDSISVRRGSIRGVVMATGEVVSERQALLSSQVAGRISSIPVEIGQQVDLGTLLVSVEIDTLRYRVEEAQLRVRIAQLRLDQLQEGARSQEIALAQADLEIAQTRLNGLLASTRMEDVASIRREVEQAQAALTRTQHMAAAQVERERLGWEIAVGALRQAQDMYGQAYGENEGLRQQGMGLSQAQEDAEAWAWRRLEGTTAAVEGARLAYEEALQEQESSILAAWFRLTQAHARLQELLAQPAGAQILQAQADLARAQAYLELQQAEPRSSDLQIRRQELELAQLDLAEAQANLDRATIRAPFAGTVVERMVDEGEQVGVYAPLLRLADLGRLRVEARIDEIDVGQVEPGQAVTLTLDAFPGQPLRGSVQEVAPAVTVDRGSPFYLATIVLVNPPSLPLRLGMAANLSIVTVEREDVLLIPRLAVERVGEGSYVTVLRDGRSQRIRVTLGLSDPLHYEVLDGLAEGERVVLP